MVPRIWKRLHGGAISGALHGPGLVVRLTETIQSSGRFAHEIFPRCCAVSKDSCLLAGSGARPEKGGGRRVAWMSG